jgi:hypothetical protein
MGVVHTGVLWGVMREGTTWKTQAKMEGREVILKWMFE